MSVAGVRVVEFGYTAAQSVFIVHSKDVTAFLRRDGGGPDQRPVITWPPYKPELRVLPVRPSVSLSRAGSYNSKTRNAEKSKLVCIDVPHGMSKFGRQF